MWWHLLFEDKSGNTVQDSLILEMFKDIKMSMTEMYSFNISLDEAKFYKVYGFEPCLILWEVL